MGAFEGDFVLDTTNFSSVAHHCQDLANKMRQLKQDLDNGKVEVLTSWEGKGSKAFQKKYHFLIQQLGDVTDELFDIAESIWNAEDSYIQTDMDAAKSMDGVSSPIQ